MILPNENVTECATSEALAILGKAEFDQTVEKYFRYRYNLVLGKDAVTLMADVFAKSLDISTPFTLTFAPAASSRCDFVKGFAVNGLFHAGSPYSRVKCKSTIYIRERSLIEMIGTTAHEVRHAWQFLKGYWADDSEQREHDAQRYQHAVLEAFDLPKWADLMVGKGAPPARFDPDQNSVSVAGWYHFDRESGAVYRALGDAPWPQWIYHRTVDLARLQDT